MTCPMKCSPAASSPPYRTTPSSPGAQSHGETCGSGGTSLHVLLSQRSSLPTHLHSGELRSVCPSLFSCNLALPTQQPGWRQPSPQPAGLPAHCNASRAVLGPFGNLPSFSVPPGLARALPPRSTSRGDSQARSEVTAREDEAFGTQTPPRGPAPAGHCEHLEAPRAQRRGGAVP